MSSRINVVMKVEHHALDTCPCDHCKQERELTSQSNSDHTVRITPESAYRLGIIKKLTPEGSKVRQLMKSVES